MKTTYISTERALRDAIKRDRAALAEVESLMGDIRTAEQWAKRGDDYHAAARVAAMLRDRISSNQNTALIYEH